MKAGLSILASAQLAPHVNRLPFKGVLTFLDRPSNRAPNGSRGRRVILTKQAAESALHTLIGMAIDYSPDFNRHDARRKVGVITDAHIVDDRIEVLGYIFARDFPEIPEAYEANGKDWGMSYEMAGADIESMQASIWKITETTFTGAAIILRHKAAYSKTKFELIKEGLA